MLRKTNIFKEILEYLFKTLCDTLNIIENAFTANKNDIRKARMSFFYH